MKIRENVKIAELTTMRLGGEAKLLIDIEQKAEIPEVFRKLKDQGMRFFILGEGANTLGRDEGFLGAIVRNRIRGIKIVEEGEEEILIRGEGGENWDDFVGFASDLGWSGIEAMSAIPGSLGAAPVQNIGAYGQEIGDVVEEIEVFEFRTGEFKRFGREELDFGYRKSIFNQGSEVGKYFIVGVVVRLKKATLRPPFYTSLQKYIDENQETDFSPKNIRKMVRAVRGQKLPAPKEIASAGSFFKNIYLDEKKAEEARSKGIQVWSENGKNVLNSGWLIEQAGLKGREFYGMRVSEKAALVLINESAKSFADLEKAREEIKQIVKQKFGYELEQEPMEIK